MVVHVRRTTWQRWVPMEFCWAVLWGRDWPNFFSTRVICLNFGMKIISSRSLVSSGCKDKSFFFCIFSTHRPCKSARGSASEGWPGWPSSSPWRCTFPHRPGAQSQMAESTCVRNLGKRSDISQSSKGESHASPFDSPWNHSQSECSALVI